MNTLASFWSHCRKVPLITKFLHYPCDKPWSICCPLVTIKRGIHINEQFFEDRMILCKPQYSICQSLRRGGWRIISSQIFNFSQQQLFTVSILVQMSECTFESFSICLTNVFHLIRDTQIFSF